VNMLPRSTGPKSERQIDDVELLEVKIGRLCIPSSFLWTRLE
jgi:hypothetical protein